jgi:hypothetical protein
MASCTGYEPTEAAGPFQAMIAGLKAGKSMQTVKAEIRTKYGPKAPYSPDNIVGNLTPELVARYHLTKDQIFEHQKAQLRLYDPQGEARDAASRAGAKHAGEIDKTFGSGVQKAIVSAGTNIAKVATAPVTAIGGTALDIAKGKNVLQALKTRGADLGKSVIQGGKILGNVASFVPGIGTAAAFAIRYTSSVADAVAQGKNIAGSLEHAAVDAALNSLPGGELTGAAIKAVANMTAAGIEGKNVLKSAATELTGAAISMVPSADAQAILKGATDAALSGENVLQGAKAAAIKDALAQIPNDAARNAIAATLQGKSPESIVENAGSQLLSRAAAAMPTGGVAAVVTGITGKSPNQIIEAGKNMANMYKTTSVPTMVPRPGTARPVLQAVRAPERSLEDRASLPRPMRGIARVTHRPLTNRARLYIQNRAGNIGKDVSGLTQDGKWLVQAGDTGQKIAKAVTGDQNRWKELIAVNPNNMKVSADVKAYGFPVYTYKYNPINLPASWVKPATAPQPAPASVPVSVLPQANPVSTILTQVSTVLAPAGDAAAQGQARAILATWGKTDGSNQAGLTDYGGFSEIGATSWSARDVLMAASFGRWFNANVAAQHGLSALTPDDGQWNQNLADDLHYWAELKAAAVLPGVPAAVTPATQAPTTSSTQNQPVPSGSPSQSLPQLPQLPPLLASGTTPTVTVSPSSTTAQTPSGGGTINLPGITIGSGSASAGTAPTASQQAAKPGFIAENKASLIPMAIGAVVSYASKFV